MNSDQPARGAAASLGAPPPPSTRYQRLFTPHFVGLDSTAHLLVSELLALTDFSAALTEPMTSDEVASLLLLVGLGETRARWVGLLLPDGDRMLRPAGRRGATDPAWRELSFLAPAALPREAVLRDGAPGTADDVTGLPIRNLLRRARADSVVILRSGDQLTGLLLVGAPHPILASAGRDDFLEALAVIASAALEKCRRDEELRATNRRLALRAYQLRSLLDLTAGLHRARDERAVWDLLLHGAMGHALASRGSVVAGGRVVASKGPRRPRGDRRPLVAADAASAGRHEAFPVSDLKDPGLVRDLGGLRIGWIAPFVSGPVRGTLFLGEAGLERGLESSDRAFLASLAGRAAAAVENARLHRATIEKEKELVLARRIQSRLLPAEPPRLPGWDIAGVNIPCLAVGGDYYDYAAHGDRLFVTIADVSGKGEGPALLMALVQASLTSIYRHGQTELDGAAVELNQLLHEKTDANRYMSAVLASLSPRTGRMDYLNAGHVRPVVLRADRSVERLHAGSTVLGLFPHIETEVGCVDLEPGDVLAMYTDGLTEAEDVRERQFDDHRVIEALGAARDRDARAICGDLLSGARAFAGPRALQDDLTLIVLKREAGDPR